MKYFVKYYDLRKARDSNIFWSGLPLAIITAVFMISLAIMFIKSFF